jgi:hypothetical protein
LKRNLAFAALLLIVLAAILMGNRIVASTLDARLAPLLTRQLGLPVNLEPITARVMTLTAKSPRLVVGDSNNPVVVATNVEVSLSLAALLSWEIRLDIAVAENLLVNLTQWPRTDGPLPEDYLFLDQWLPRTISLDSGRYVFPGGDTYPVRAFRWQRNGDEKAGATWLDVRGEREFEVAVSVTSLRDLLMLAPLDMALGLEVPGDAASRIDLKASIRPGESAAYDIAASVSAAGMALQMQASGSRSWYWPDSSTITIPEIQVEAVNSLLTKYAGDEKQREPFFDLPLPVLDLPAHSGSIAIDQLSADDELVLDTSFDFELGEAGIRVSNLASLVPAARLEGGLSVEVRGREWQVDVEAIVSALDEETSVGATLLAAENDWHWRTGSAKVSGRGNTLGGLLDTLQGKLSISGDYRTEVDTPFSISARLDEADDQFAFEEMSIHLGEGVLSGSATISAEKSDSGQRTLTLVLAGKGINLEFLAPGEGEEPKSGVAVPFFLGVLPELAIDASLDISDFDASGLSLARGTAHLRRDDRRGSLVATAEGRQYGSLDLRLTANYNPDVAEDFSLDANFDRIDLDEMFQQGGVLHSRTSGSLSLESGGGAMIDVFREMRGRAELSTELRGDDNWQRAPREEEKLELAGNARLVLREDRLVGVEISKLEVATTEQGLTGTLAMVAGTSPWLTADLESKNLNVTDLLELLPESTEEADRADLLDTLRLLGAARISLEAEKITVAEVKMQGMSMEVNSAKDYFGIDRLDFNSFGGAFESSGKITWEGGRASFLGTANLRDINLDQFLIRTPQAEIVPVSGTTKLLSEGETVSELYQNISGHIDLDGGQPGAPQHERRTLQMVAEHISGGVRAEIRSLQWADSELAGTLVYRGGTRPNLELTLHGGKLSLEPWERAAAAPLAEERVAEGNFVERAAEASADLVGRLLRTPFVAFTQSGENSGSDRFFSADPLPFEALGDFDLVAQGRLNQITSTVATLGEVEVDARLQAGMLELKASVGELGGGHARADIALDTRVTPATLAVTGEFHDVRGFSGEDTYTRTGYVKADTRGASQAELAANLDGLLYLKFGSGPFDYANSALLNADLATSAFRRLIPGIERREPYLECGVTVGLFKDGHGVTPYGFAARTRQANLLLNVELDLRKEQLQMSFDSRSRQGVGLSVGNVFSNTVRISGPIHKPRIVPNTTGILWRGAAAFMTAGLSVVGEGVLKRALASQNPCKSIQGIIERELCPNSEVVQNSGMICSEG